MIEPAIPANECERLEALHSLNILDTPRDRRFDRLTRIAQRFFGVKIAVVSLVDKDRQWFKSVQGMEADETPRNVSFCGHAILGKGLFLIPDALKDERFKDNPLVTGDPKVRFYAGFPIRGMKGHALGTLCIIDDKPRDLCPEDQAMLADMAAVTEDAITASQMATLDDLTGLYNRRGFRSSARQAVSVCKRLKKSSVLITFDLDGFKEVNDTYGHDEGDTALIAFAGLLRNQFRDSDVCGRIGGDEFVVLASNVDENDIPCIMDRFAKSVEDYNQQSGKEYDIRYSAGFVGKASDRHVRFDDLMREADARMYERKRISKEKSPD